MRKVWGKERLALRLIGLLLQLRLELLLLLLEKVDTAETKTHHICSHHIREHVWEIEGGHLVVMAASSGAELLKTLQLRLRLR